MLLRCWRRSRACSITSGPRAPCGRATQADSEAIETVALIALGLWMLGRADDDRRPGRRAAPCISRSPGTRCCTRASSCTSPERTTSHGISAWTPAAAIALPTLLAIALIGRAAGAALAGRRAARHLRARTLQAMAGGADAVGARVNLVSDGSMAPLPYLPLLNPLDLGHALVLLYALRLARLAPWSARARTAADRARGGALLLVAELAADSQLAPLGRHADVARRRAGLRAGADEPHAAVDAHRADRRCSTPHGALHPRLRAPVWMAGAVLLGVVVLKLFVVDLSNVGTLARIVSFLVVGALMLVIGYVSPLPPSPAAPAMRHERKSLDETLGACGLDGVLDRSVPPRPTRRGHTPPSRRSSWLGTRACNASNCRCRSCRLRAVRASG